MGILPVRELPELVAPTRDKPGESRWRWDQLSLGQNDCSAQFAPSVAVSDLFQSCTYGFGEISADATDWPAM